LKSSNNILSFHTDSLGCEVHGYDPKPFVTYTRNTMELVKKMVVTEEEWRKKGRPVGSTTLIRELERHGHLNDTISYLKVSTYWKKVSIKTEQCQVSFERGHE